MLAASIATEENGMIRSRRQNHPSSHADVDLAVLAALAQSMQLDILALFLQLGDNIFGSSTPDAAESLFKAFGPAMESGIPWAAVLGNHDQESSMNRAELMSLISLMDYSVSQINPSIDGPTKIDGFGNYNLRVYGAPGSILANSSVMNLFFLDSGARAVYQGLRTYDWIKESQLHWLRHVSPEFQDDKEGIENGARFDGHHHKSTMIKCDMALDDLNKKIHSKIRFGEDQFVSRIVCWFLQPFTGSKWIVGKK